MPNTTAVSRYTLGSSLSESTRPAGRARLPCLKPGSHSAKDRYMEEFSASLDFDGFRRLIEAAANEIEGDLATHRRAIIERVKAADTGTAGETRLQVQVTGN